MPDPTNTAENLEQQFDIDKVLNNKDFLKFLAKHPDAKDFDMDNTGDVSKRFETFTQKEMATKGLKAIYAEHIEKEIGIKLSKDDLEAIEEEIEKRAVTSPEDVSAQLKTVMDFEQASKSTQDLFVELHEIGALKEGGSVEDIKEKLSSLEKQRDMLVLAKDYFGFFGTGRFLIDVLTFPKPSLGQLKDIWDTKKQIEAEFKTSDRSKLQSIEKNILGEIAEHQEQIAKITDTAKKLEAAGLAFDKIQKGLLGEMAGFESFTAILQKRAMNSIGEMMSKGTISAFAKAQERFQKLETFRDQTVTGVNPLEGMNIEIFQEILNMRAEEKIKEHITKAVKDAKLGNNALSNLEKVLTESVLKEDAGSKTTEETKQFVIDTIDEVREGIPDDEDGRMKKVILARILVKLQK